MRILHISGARSWGGNEQQLILNINELNQFQTTNFIFGIENSPLNIRAQKNQINFISCKASKISKISNISQLKNIINSNQIDVIHLHTSDSLTLLYLFSIFNQIIPKVIFSKKGIGGSSSFLSKLKYNANFIDKIICVSKSVKDNFKPMLKPKSQQKTTVVYDCISFKIHPTISDELKNRFKVIKGNYIIGSIANHTKAKDLPNLIEAISILKYKYKLKNFKLIQVGEFTKHTDELKKLIQEKDLFNEIILTDKIENAMQLNVLFDTFVVSSSREGGPTSSLEAMLYKTPVVTTSVGVMPEIIDHEKNGFICPPHEPEILAKSLYDMYSLNQEKIAEIKETNYNLIKDNFTSTKIAQQILAIYQS